MIKGYCHNRLAAFYNSIGFLACDIASWAYKHAEAHQSEADFLQGRLL